MAVFWAPLVLLLSERAPTATLLLPVLSRSSAWLPTATLFVPDVTEANAPVPTMTLVCACAVPQKNRTAAELMILVNAFIVFIVLKVRSGPLVVDAKSAANTSAAGRGRRTRPSGAPVENGPRGRLPQFIIAAPGNLAKNSPPVRLLLVCRNPLQGSQPCGQRGIVILSGRF